MGDIGTMIGNVPGSAYNVGAGLVNTVTSPIQTAKGIAGIGEGALDWMTGQETQEAEMAKMAFKEITRMLHSPWETMVKDPVGAMLDVASIAFPVGGMAMKGGQGAAMAGKIAGAARKVNPIRVAIKMGRSRPVKWTQKAIKDRVIAALGETTGVGGEAAKIAVGSGRVGGGASRAFRKPPKLLDFADEVLGAVDDARAMKRMRMDTAVTNMVAETPLDPRGVRAKMFDYMNNEWGIKTIETLDADNVPRITLDLTKAKKIKFDNMQASKVKKLGEILTEWGDDVSVEGAWGTRQAIDSMIKTGIAGADVPQVNAVMTGVRRFLTQELNSKVVGFADANKAYAQASEFIKLAEKVFGLKRGGLDDAGIFGEVPTSINEAMLTKMGNLLNTRTSQNLGLRRQILQELEVVMKGKRLKDKGIHVDDVFDDMKSMNLTPDDRIRIIDEAALQNGVEVNFFEELAGMRFGEPEVMGIARAKGTGMGALGMGATLGAGAGGFVGGPVGGAIGSAIGIGMMQLVANMTIKNPRAVGRFLHALGASEKGIVAGAGTLLNQENKAAQVQRVFNAVKMVTPDNLVQDGITFGAALERLKERSKEAIEVKKAARGK